MSAAQWGQSVDLATGFAACWTNDGDLADVEEFARQLHESLGEVLRRGATVATDHAATREWLRQFAPQHVAAWDALVAERDEAVKAELDYKDAATEWMRKAKAAEAVLREIASYADDGDRNDDIVSGYGLAKIARGFIDQPTKREMGVDAPDFGPTLGSNRGD